MRAVVLIALLALAGFSRAAVQKPCTQSGISNTNTGGSCTATGDSPASQAITCDTGFIVVRSGNAAPYTYACTATPTTGTAPACPTHAYQTSASVPPTGTCQVSQPTTPVNGATVDTALVGTFYTAPTATTATCNTIAATTTPAAAARYFTPSAIAAPVATTAGNTPFSATPANTWVCNECPANCVDCTPAATKGPSPATGAQTGCAKAVAGYYIDKSGTADATSGLYPAATAVKTCPKAITATYGVNATADSCTACDSATNCTAASCATGTMYYSYAATPGIGVKDSVNFSAFSGVPTTGIQGCYKTADLQTWYGPKTAATTSGVRMTISAVVVAVVAAVFAL